MATAIPLNFLNHRDISANNGPKLTAVPTPTIKWKKVKIKVIVQDLSKIFYPNLNYIKAKNFKNSIRFKSLNEWVESLNLNIPLGGQQHPKGFVTKRFWSKIELLLLEGFFIQV